MGGSEKYYTTLIKRDQSRKTRIRASFYSECSTLMHFLYQNLPFFAKRHVNEHYSQLSLSSFRGR